MTGLTYQNRDQAQDDRLQQERLLTALDAAPSQLRRDEAGWWIIAGRRGTIHTWGDGKSWLAYVRCRSRQHWTFTKRRLAFMTVTQDGDEEGWPPTLPPAVAAGGGRDPRGGGAAEAG